MSSSIDIIFYSFKVKFISLPHFPDRQQPLLPKFKKKKCVFIMQSLILKGMSSASIFVKGQHISLRLGTRRWGENVSEWPALWSEPSLILLTDQVKKHFDSSENPSIINSSLSNPIAPNHRSALCYYHTPPVISVPTCDTEHHMGRREDPRETELFWRAMTSLYLLLHLASWPDVAGDH